MNSLKIYKIFIICLAITFFAFIAILNFPFYGQSKISMTLGENTPKISKLGPPPRVIIEGGYQRVLESPVYFDVRTFPWFKKAQVYITYQEHGQTLEGLGGQTSFGFNYHVQEPIVVRDLQDGWKKAVFEFDLNQVFYNEGLRRFLISTKSNDQSEKEELYIQDIKVILFL